MRPVAVRPVDDGPGLWQIDLALQFEAGSFDEAMERLGDVWRETKGEEGIEIAGLGVRGPWCPPHRAKIGLAGARPRR